MMIFLFLCFFKQKTAYEVRISDWSSDVCSSDLAAEIAAALAAVVCRVTVDALGPASWPRHAEAPRGPLHRREVAGDQIGRASCRERVCQYVSISVADVSLKKNSCNN